MMPTCRDVRGVSLRRVSERTSARTVQIASLSDRISGCLTVLNTPRSKFVSSSRSVCVTQAAARTAHEVLSKLSVPRSKLSCG